jgi:hypothetical protein
MLRLIIACFLSASGGFLLAGVLSANTRSWLEQRNSELYKAILDIRTLLRKGKVEKAIEKAREVT